MRAHEFIVEYSQQKTIQNFGEKLLYRYTEDAKEHGNFDMPREILKALNIVDSAMNGKIDLSNETWAKYEQFVSQFVLSQIEQFDPTNHKEYVQWIVKNYLNGNIKRFEDLGRVQAALTRFNNLKKRKVLQPEHRDINRLNFDQLQTILETTYAQEAEESSKEEQRQLSAKMKSESEVFYEDGSVTVIVPKTEQASCYFGKGTRWCTAATDSRNYFEQYNRDGALYIVVPKHPKYSGEKYQLHFGSDQFMDENDDPINLLDLSNRFPDLFAKFKQETNISKYLVFTDDNILKKLLSDIGDNVEEAINDTISDIESSDESYYSEMQDKYPLYDEEPEDEDEDWEPTVTGVDWEALDEDDYYTNWNLDLKYELDDIHGVLNMSPNELKQSDYVVDEDGNIATLDSLEDLISKIIREKGLNYRYSSFSENIADWIDKNLAVRVYDGKWKLLRKQVVFKNYPEDHKEAGKRYRTEEWTTVGKQ